MPRTFHTLTPALLGWIAGITLQLQQASLWNPWLYLLLPGAAFIALLLRSRLALPAGWTKPLPTFNPSVNPGTVFSPVLAFVFAAALGHASTGLRAVQFEQQALDPALEGRDLQLTGRIASMPQFGENSTRFHFIVEQAFGRDKESGNMAPVKVPKRIYLSWYGGLRNDEGLLLESYLQAPKLQAGERWRFNARLRAPHGALNPHGFDYELWLWERDLQATGYVRTTRRDPRPERLEDSAWHGIERVRQNVRDAIVAPDTDANNQGQLSVTRNRNDQEGRARGIVAALVTGDQQAIARDNWDMFRTTGVAHLMSISGLHITLFAWLAVKIIGGLWRRFPRLCLLLPAPHAGLIGGLFCALAYALFSGWGVPAQRTVLMLAVMTLLQLAGRRWPWPQVWLLAAAVVLAADPWALLQAGFWLSFVAVGVLFAMGRPDAPTPVATQTTTPSPSALRLRMQPVINLLREQSLITLALAPLTLLLFGQISLVSLLANLVAIPWVTLVVTPLSLLGVLLPPLWDLAAASVHALGWVLQWLADWPLAAVSLPAAPMWAALAGVLGGVLLALPLPWNLRVTGLPLLLPALLWQPAAPAPGQFEVLAVDVGQGQAVLVRTARHALLYDAGPRYSNESDAGDRIALPLLRALGVRLDLLVLSHRDTDHTGGAASVLRAHPQAQLLSSLEPSHELHAGLAPGRSLRCEGDDATGQRWSWDGVYFEVLHPKNTDYPFARRSNPLSCVLRVSNGTQTALLAGDIERDQELRLVREHASIKSEILRSDLLLVPHHGSRTSSTAEFLNAVQPSIALVQAGYRNRYGHPAPDVMARYAERSIPVFNNARCGAATWRSTEPETVECEREKRQRYWHHR